MRRVDGDVGGTKLCSEMLRRLDASRYRIQVLVENDRFLCAIVAQVHGQCAGIDAPFGWQRRRFPQSSGRLCLDVQLRLARSMSCTTSAQYISLHDRRIDAVVAYLWISQSVTIRPA